MTNEQYFKSLKNEGIPFMETRTKGDVRDLIDTVVHIIDFGFIRGDNGEYVVFITKENDKEFYCGGKAVTELLKQIKTDNMGEALKDQAVTVTELTSKNKRKYITLMF